jgi:A/G-specific adenine glycosylase
MSKYTALHDRLHRWYLKNGRHDLPWRQTRDPYKIYLSEIMLQQTQVATVLERFYFPLLERFLTLKHVADASEEAVLKAWEGLGYYSRARNLYQTAKLTGGELPRSAEELERLPGIGRSTARAIACFAYREPLPILDANVRRILYRFFRRRKATEKELWSMAERLFDAARAYDYNQAMMDLGATHCTPKGPDCARCPLAEECRGKERPERYPESRKRKKIPVRRRKILLHSREGRWALVRSGRRFHGGLWRFPQSEEAVDGVLLGQTIYRYSHFTLEAEIIRVRKLSFEENVLFFGRREIADLPLGGIDRKILSVYIH